MCFGRLNRFYVAACAALLPLVLLSCGWNSGPGSVVDLRDNRSVTDEDIAQRLKSDAHTIDLGGTRVTDRAILHFGQCPRVDYVALDRTGITDAGVNSLAELPRLKSLDLDFTHVTDEGLRSIGNIEGLEHLWIPGTDITDAGLKYLSHCKSLHILRLPCTAVTANGILRCKRSFPRPRLTGERCRRCASERPQSIWGKWEFGLRLVDQRSIRPSQSRTSDSYVIILDERPIPNESIKAANGLLGIIAETESIFVQAMPLTENAAKFVRGISHIGRLQFKIDKNTTLEDIQALTSVGRIDSIDFSGSPPDPAMLEALSSAHGVKELSIESNDKVPDEGLAHLSHLTTLMKLGLFFKSCSAESMERVGKISSLRELTVPTSVSPEAIKSFRAAHPDIKVLTQEIIP